MRRAIETTDAAKTPGVHVQTEFGMLPGRGVFLSMAICESAWPSVSKQGITVVTRIPIALYAKPDGFMHPSTGGREPAPRESAARQPAAGHAPLEQQRHAVVARHRQPGGPVPRPAGGPLCMRTVTIH